MLEQRDLQLVRLAVRRRLITAEQGEDLLNLRRRLGAKHTLEALAVKRGYLDEAALARLDADVVREARARVPQAPATPSPRASLPSSRPRPSPAARAGPGSLPAIHALPTPEARDPVPRAETEPGAEPVTGDHAPAEAASRAATRIGPPAAPAPPTPDMRRSWAAQETLIEARAPRFDPAPIVEERTRIMPLHALEVAPEAPRELELVIEAPELLDAAPLTRAMKAVPQPTAPAAPPTTLLLDTRAVAGTRPPQARGLERGQTFAGAVVRGGLEDGELGQSYRADDAASASRVFLKVLPEALSADPAYLRRFLRDTERARAVAAPSLTPLLRAGREAGRLFTVSSLVEGFTLRERVETDGTLTAQEGLELAHTLVAALSPVHAAGLAHGRVSPDHVLFDREGAVHLVGLGAPEPASPRGADRRHAPFVAPERLAGGESSAAADLYALAATLVHAWTGAPPDEPVASAAAATTLESRLLARGLPIPLVEPIVLALAADPAARLAGVEPLGERLRAAEQQTYPAGVFGRWRSTLAGVGAASLSLSAALLLAIVAVAALARRSGAVAWGRGELIRSSALGSDAALGLALVMLVGIGLVRRGQLPLPGSTTWLVGLDDLLGLVGASGVVFSALLGPPALLSLVAAGLGALVAMSAVFGFFLRRFVAASRRDGGVGRMLAVIGDPRLRRWRWLHVPLLVSLFAVAGLRVAVLAYFAGASRATAAQLSVPWQVAQVPAAARWASLSGATWHTSQN